MPPNRALDAAIALCRAPNLAGNMRLQELPPGLDLLLRLLANDPAALREAREIGGTGVEDPRVIAEFYVLEVMLFPGASARRILGASRDSDRAQIRTHMVLLLKWLHPDKNGLDWEAAFSARVINAWRAYGEGAPEESQPQSLMTSPRARRRGRSSWIAQFPEHAPPRRHKRLSKRLRAVLIGATLLTCLAIPSDAAYQISQILLAVF